MAIQYKKVNTNLFMPSSLKKEVKIAVFIFAVINSTIIPSKKLKSKKESFLKYYMDKRIAAFLRLDCSHHMDHIIPLCDLLGAKFVACDEDHLELAQRYYPNLETEFLDRRMLHTEYVKEFYDIIIHSFSWPKKLIDYELMPEKETSKRKIRCIHIPHGNSDKGYYSGILRYYVLQDICLIYGDHMIDMLKRLELFSSLKNTLEIGNLRYSYYIKYKAFFDEIADQEIFRKLNPSKKTIIYAPTWDDFEKSTSIYDVYQFVLENLPKKYNLIVKLHPYLGHESIGQVYHIIGKYEAQNDILFLREYPTIYPLLARSDIYLGDLSSIGYDFLAFNRPMFFFNHLQREENDPSLFLHQCGTVIPLQDGTNILSYIENGLANDALFEPKRKKIYQYAFGKPKNPDELKQKLLHLCENQE